MSNSPAILFIDRHPEDLDYYTQRLRTSSPDFVIIHAEAGKSGLSICKRQPIDCVVLEFDLPDMSGFEVLLELIPRAKHPEVAVIFLTRLENRYLMEAAIRNGAQAALYKPLTSGDGLDKAIQKAVSAVPRDRKRPTENSDA